jgi:CubicO group peptidase (beta-lactamase class C family)
MTDFTSKVCRKCSLALIFMLFLQSTYSQQDFTALDAIIAKNQKALGKDLVVAINKEGKNIFLKETDELKLKTPAPIASCSKWLTAALVMIFVDEGKINLDEPLATYIPLFEKNMKGYITLRNCLSHTTGLDVGPSGVLKLAQRSKFNSLEEEIVFFATKKEIIDNPGQAFAYSGVGLNIAGRVIEIVSKKSFDRVITEKLFRPLGMKTATFYNDNGGAINPSAGAICSAFDYLNFMQMILNKGMFNGKRILSERAIDEMMKTQTLDMRVRSTPESGKGLNYALGSWIQEDENGRGTVFTSPGAFGTWPWIDTKRNYVGIIFAKSLLGEQKKELYLRMKETADNAIDQ